MPKVNIQQDRTHGFASLFFPLTLHPAAVLRTGNASWLLTSVSLTFYPMVDSAAEVSEYPPAYPPLSFHPLVVNEAEGDVTSSRLSPTIVLLAGSQRSGRGRDKLPSILHYRSTRWWSTKRKGTKQAPVYPPLSFHSPVVNEAEENETSSRLSPTIVPPVVVNEAEGGVTSSRLPATIVLLAGSQRSGRGEHASHPPHEVRRLSPPSPVCPTRGSRHRPAWAHHPQA